MEDSLDCWQLTIEKKSGFRSESEDCPSTENKSHCMVEDTHTNTHIIELMETVKLDVPYH